MWLFYYFNFKRNYDILKSKSPCILLNKNIKFNKKETKSKLENPTLSFREANLVLQLIWESQIKTVMSWSLWKKIESIFSTVYFVWRELFVFYFNLQPTEYTFSICILLHIKKHYFIHFCCLFLKPSKAFSVSLSKVSVFNKIVLDSELYIKYIKLVHIYFLIIRFLHRFCSSD